MKRLVIAVVGVLWVSLLGCACTIAITPIKQKPAKRSKQSVSHPKPKHKAPPAKSKPAETNNIKETWWIENYKKLESFHGDYTIPSDANIKPLPDGRFKVPDSVLTHYQDLLLASPSATPY